MEQKVCMCCNELGYISDHSSSHYSNSQDTDCFKYGCPVQIECEECNGTGCITEISQNPAKVKLKNK
jgi:RecJ-like exonuclease